jgi:hypothetical protein
LRPTSHRRDVGRRSRGALVVTRALALPAIAAVLGAYVVVHSPLNHSIASLLGFSSSQCYPCGGTPGAGRAVDSLVALLFVALAVLAAAFLSALLADAAEEKLIAFGLIALAFVVLPSASLGAIGSASTWAFFVRPGARW